MSKKSFFILAVTVSLYSCFNIFEEPNSTVVKSIPNPNKKFQAVLLNSEGDATVDFSLQVSLLPIDYKFKGNEIGNIFSVDNNHGVTNLDLSSIHFTWLSDDTLKIIFNRSLRIFTQLRKINNVVVVYEAQ